MVSARRKPRERLGGDSAYNQGARPTSPATRPGPAWHGRMRPLASVGAQLGTLFTHGRQCCLHGVALHRRVGG